MTRELTGHLVGGANNGLHITTEGVPGRGGAHCRYRVQWPDSQIDPPGCGHQGGNSIDIVFQSGPLKDGANGLTNEALLAILIDRLAGFQSGEFACDDNADALAHCRNALAMLKKRTLRRLERGVEGTYEK